ncbi:MAG: FAD-dependent oxidoreductase [Dysgonamonadaceae bacterium]|jgi:ferredoxin-NADP reductase|nr:FAD-dependent oxidoreductase [Dysgonamonadaceae bacterium]
MLAKKYKAEIMSIQNPTSGVYTLEFSSPKKFKFAPGEFLHLALDEYDPSSAWPESRCFSIQTSPQEENIKITYSVKGAFTKRMENELVTGREVWLKLPFGDLFTQEHDKNNTVFIAGGTGITPFLSLFTDNSFAEYSNPNLYLGVRNKDLHFYHNELKKAKLINQDIQATVFYQDTDGVIDIEKIYSMHPDAGAFFISGPPAMIKGFKQYLTGKGVEEDKVKTDDWE